MIAVHDELLSTLSVELVPFSCSLNMRTASVFFVFFLIKVNDLQILTYWH